MLLYLSARLRYAGNSPPIEQPRVFVEGSEAGSVDPPLFETVPPDFRGFWGGGDGLFPGGLTAVWPMGGLASGGGVGTANGGGATVGCWCRVLCTIGGDGLPKM